MRRADREIKDRAEMMALLDRLPQMSLGLCDGDMPYVVPLNFVREGNFIYFHCAAEGRKLNLIKINPSVCVCAATEGKIVPGDRPASYTTHYESVIITGRAEVVNSEIERVGAFNAMMRKFAPKSGMEVTAGQAKGAAVVRISIDTISGKRNPNY